MRYVMALDQGTTSSRAILFDASGAIVASDQHDVQNDRGEREDSGARGHQPDAASTGPPGLPPAVADAHVKGDHRAQQTVVGSGQERQAEQRAEPDESSGARRRRVGQHPVIGEAHQTDEQERQARLESVQVGEIIYRPLLGAGSGTLVKLVLGDIP